MIRILPTFNTIEIVLKILKTTVNTARVPSDPKPSGGQEQG